VSGAPPCKQPRAAEKTTIEGLVACAAVVSGAQGGTVARVLAVDEAIESAVAPCYYLLSTDKACTNVNTNEDTCAENSLDDLIGACVHRNAGRRNLPPYDPFIRCASALSDPIILVCLNEHGKLVRLATFDPRTTKDYPIGQWSMPQ